MRIVVKVGGSGLEHAEGRRALVRSVRAARADGHEVVIVHGGGNQIRAWSRRLGLADGYHGGLRITDADTAEVVTAVLGGLVNKELVAALAEGGVRAAGLTGADGGTFAVVKHAPGGKDLGFVGAVCEVRPELLGALLAAGLVPVVATVGPLAAGERGSRSRLYNVNADMAAATLAGALGAEALVFLTDVDAVRDDRGRPVRRLGPATAARLAASGALGAGMRPKVSSALDARALLPHAHVVIASGAGTDSIRAALRAGAGTVVTAHDPPPSPAATHPDTETA